MLTPGHERALAQLEDGHGYELTRGLYRSIGGIDVYLRPTGAGFTVLSLDHERCCSMVGVGGPGKAEQQHKIHNLPPTLEVVSFALERYREKVAALKRASPEERHALVLVADALRTNLRLPRDGTFFLHQEWNLKERAKLDILGVEARTAEQSLVSEPRKSSKLDILGVEARTGRLVVIELKASEKSARKVEVKKGGNAWAQASFYKKNLHSHRAQLYPFFERLGRALAALHQAPTEMLSLRIDPHHLPIACVSWPGGAILECDNA